MAIAFNKTHECHQKSWVDSANGHLDFPIQNLPWGVFLSEKNGLIRSFGFLDQIILIRFLFIGFKVMFLLRL